MSERRIITIALRVSFLLFVVSKSSSNIREEGEVAGDGCVTDRPIVIVVVIRSRRRRRRLKTLFVPLQRFRRRKKVATALVISLQRRSGIEIENVCLFGNVFGILL